MVATLEERGGGTEVTIAFDQLPPGIRPEDNDAGSRRRRWQGGRAPIPVNRGIVGSQRPRARQQHDRSIMPQLLLK